MGEFGAAQVPRFGERETIPQQDQVLMSPGSKAAWKTRAASSGAAANEPCQGLGELLAERFKGLSSSSPPKSALMLPQSR